MLENSESGVQRGTCGASALLALLGAPIYFFGPGCFTAEPTADGSITGTRIEASRRLTTQPSTAGITPKSWTQTYRALQQWRAVCPVKNGDCDDFVRGLIQFCVDHQLKCYSVFLSCFDPRIGDRKVHGNVFVEFVNKDQLMVCAIEPQKAAPLVKENRITCWPKDKGSSTDPPLPNQSNKERICTHYGMSKTEIDVVYPGVVEDITEVALDRCQQDAQNKRLPKGETCPECCKRLSEPFLSGLNDPVRMYSQGWLEKCDRECNLDSISAVKVEVPGTTAGSASAATGSETNWGPLPPVCPVGYRLGPQFKIGGGELINRWRCDPNENGTNRPAVEVEVWDCSGDGFADRINYLVAGRANVYDVDPSGRLEVAGLMLWLANGIYYCYDKDGDGVISTYVTTNSEGNIVHQPKESIPYSFYPMGSNWPSPQNNQSNKTEDECSLKSSNIAKPDQC